MTYDPHSTHSKQNKSPHNTRRKWLLGGGVIAVFLLIIIVISTTQQPAVDGMIQATQKQPADKQEKSLKTISVVSWRNDSAQKALAQYYISIGRYDLAGETLAKGSSKLSVDAARYYIEAGEYKKALTELNTIPKSQQSADTNAQQAIVAFNLEDTPKGCDYAEKSNSSDLKTACTFLRTGELSRENSYKLIAWHVYTPAVKTLTNVQQKTAGDWLSLAAIAARQNKGDTAAEQLSQAIAQFPFEREVAQQALAFCQQQGSGVAACTQLSQDAQKALKQTEFKS